MKTPEQVAAQIMGDTETTTMWSDAAGGWVTIESQLAAAIEADRAQRAHEGAMQKRWEVDTALTIAERIMERMQFAVDGYATGDSAYFEYIEERIIAAAGEGIQAGIEADRAQRHHWDGEIYIVQNDAGDVVDAFWDADEASAAYQYTASGSEYSIIQETAWEPGEYAEQRIRTLTEQWEETVNYGRDENEEPYRASDYALSEDDWRAGLDDEEAAEIARLIEWQGAQK